MENGGIDGVINVCDGTFGGPSGGGHQCVLKPGIYVILLVLQFQII